MGNDTSARLGLFFTMEPDVIESLTYLCRLLMNGLVLIVFATRDILHMWKMQLWKSKFSGLRNFCEEVEWREFEESSGRSSWIDLSWEFTSMCLK